jgi:hypothetical protein
MSGEGVSKLWGYSTLHENRGVYAFVRNWVRGCRGLALHDVGQHKNPSSRATSNLSMSLTGNHSNGIHTHVASELPRGHWAATERTCIWYQSK